MGEGTIPARRLARIDLGLRPLAAALSAALVALMASEAVRRLRRLLATTGGPIILLLANGSLLRAERRQFPAGPERRLRYLAIGTAPGDGPEDFESGSVSLAPSGSVFALRIVDMLVDGVDWIVAVRSTMGRKTLLYGTDNMFAPSTIWSGDDPAAPSWLLAEQAIRDAEWQVWLEDDPTIPRPIVVGRFDDVSTDGEASPAGWTAAGELRVIGRTRPSFRLQDEPTAGRDLVGQ